MNIITLGNCCKKSQKNHENAVIAAKNCGIAEPVVNIGDMAEIMKYGVPLHLLLTAKLFQRGVCFPWNKSKN